MSHRELAEEQPSGFNFTAENEALCQKWIQKYPADRKMSAVIPLLMIAQNQHDGWLPKPAIELVAEMLDMPYIHALEIATFYTMFNLKPVGKYLVQVCKTISCLLRGSESLERVCKKKIGQEECVREDGLFSWRRVECLGACVNAPMVQINDQNFEDLTPESFEKLLTQLEQGKSVQPGPQNGRHACEPYEEGEHA